MWHSFYIICRRVNPPGAHPLSWWQTNNPKLHIRCQLLLRERVWVPTFLPRDGRSSLTLPSLTWTRQSKRWRSSLIASVVSQTIKKVTWYWWNSTQDNFKALRGVHQNVVHKYEGPFKIVVKVGKISYKLELPLHFKIHPVFHASVLKPYHEDKEDPSWNRSQQAPITITAWHDQEIEAIIDYQVKQKRGQQAIAMFLVHWKWQTPEEATWEKYEDLWQFKDKVQEFLQQCATVVASSSGGAVTSRHNSSLILCPDSGRTFESCAENSRTFWKT